MKYSIIVPVYNGASYISKTLDMLLDHPRNDYEVIAVNDGSSDNTLSVLKEKAETTEKLVIISQENSGPSGARNTGLENANGEFILFADADDFLNINILDYLQMIEENFDLHIFNHLINYGNQIELKKMVYEHPISYFNNQDILELYLDGLVHNLWNKVYRNKIISEYKILFDENLRMGEDLLFNLNYLKYTQQIRFNNQPFYTYTKDSMDSVSKELPADYFDNQVFLFKQVLDFFSHLKKLKDDNNQKKLYADFMKNISNYMKKSASVYDRSTFTQMMKKEVLSQKSRVILDEISMAHLTRAHKILLILIKTKQFNLIYYLYGRFK